MKKYFFISLLIFIGILFAQNRDRFEITPRQGADRELVKGATVYIVHVDTGDSLQLTEYSGTRAGTYYRDNVPYGLYKIYVNGTLVRNNYPFGVDRTRSFIEAVDSDGDNKIETAGIEDLAITASKIADGAVTNSKIASGAVTNSKIATSAVTNSKLASGSVTATKIADGTVVNSKLGTSSVSSDKIVDGAVINSKLAGSAVTSDKIADSTIIKADLSEQVIQFIEASGGGTITNYPDGTTLNVNASNELYADTTNKIATISYHIADDTTALKLKNYANGQYVYLKQLSDSVNAGSGWFVVVDSAYSEGGVAFDAPETGKQWVRLEVLKKKYINVEWYGVDNTGDISKAAENQRLINRAVKDAFYTGIKKVFLPEGVYKVTTNTDTTGIALPPGVVLEGAGMDRTIIQAVDTVKSVIYVHTPLMSYVDLKDRNVTIRNLTIEGMERGNYDPRVKYGGGAGIYVVGIDGQPLNRVTIENVAVKYIWGEAFKNSLVRTVVYNNCHAIGCEFIAFDPMAVNTFIENCFVDSSYEALEYATPKKSIIGDSVSNLTINGFVAKNTYHEGINLLGGEFINISQAQIFGLDTTFSYGETHYGIAMNAAYRDNKVIKISNSTIAGFGKFGIYLYTGGDYTTDSLIIDNTKIFHTGRCGIYIAASGDTLNYFKLTNSNIEQYNGMQGVSIDYSGVYLDGVRYLEIKNNRIFSTYTTGLGSWPVSIRSGLRSIITNNDFYNPNFQPKIYFVNQSDKDNSYIANNVGLSYPEVRVGSIYYYQDWAYHNGGFWLGDSIGFKFEIQNNDSLVIKKYNNSGNYVNQTTVAK